FGVAVFTTIFAWLVLHRNRVLALLDAVELRGIDAALAARRAEEVTP
ncbi:MAG: hypothetical protein RI908_1631, partial [Actinomycetota bacterium]